MFFVLVVVYILVILEKFFYKYIKGVFDFMFMLMFVIVIIGFLIFIIVGFVLWMVSDVLINGLVGLYNMIGWIGMGIFGFFYLVIVIIGFY